MFEPEPYGVDYANPNHWCTWCGAAITGAALRFDGQTFCSPQHRSAFQNQYRPSDDQQANEG